MGGYFKIFISVKFLSKYQSLKSVLNLVVKLYWCVHQYKVDVFAFHLSQAWLIEFTDRLYLHFDPWFY